MFQIVALDTPIVGTVVQYLVNLGAMNDPHHIVACGRRGSHWTLYDLTNTELPPRMKLGDKVSITHIQWNGRYEARAEEIEGGKLIKLLPMFDVKQVCVEREEDPVP